MELELEPLNLPSDQERPIVIAVHALQRLKSKL